jgi:CheY-like chemotaxis protein
VYLEVLGHEVTVAYAGPTRAEAARERRPGVIVCDIGLPGMDGYAVARALRQDPVTAPARLIALSGYGAEADQRRGRQAGFDDYLVKPVDLADLRRLLAGRPHE